MKNKRLAAGLLALAFVFGGAVSNGAPVISQTITAQAGDVINEGCYSYNIQTGEFTIKGKIDGDAIRNFKYKKNVKSVIAEEGTVFPKDCSGLFSEYINCTFMLLSKADTSKVTNMSKMFYYCNYLREIDINGFDTSKVTDMSNMFYCCCNLKWLDLSGFNTSNVTDMSGMFFCCSCELDISRFNTSNVTNMNCMFECCSQQKSLDVSGFDTSKVTNMYRMFSGCHNLTTLDVSGFDTSNVTDMMLMFDSCANLTTLDVSNFDTSNVENMSAMFVSCHNLTTLDVSSFNTSNVTNMSDMFSWCEKLSTLDVSGFDTSKVENMSDMFSWCEKLSTLDVSGFDTSSVINMGGMFCGCSDLTSLDVSGFDTSNVIEMNYMLNNCSGLITLDLSSFDTSKVENMDYMFTGCSNLNTLTLGKNFKSITERASLPNGDGWVNAKDPATIVSGDGEYAVIENNGKNTYKLFGTVKPTYPTNIKVEYSEKYHQIRFTWDKVEGADRYGIAVYMAGKWRIQKQDITDTTYTTPKGLVTGKTYKVAVAARVNGVWDTANAIRNAVTVTVK
ncbi:BspA family leucine-rich repeat surface protein [Ruminococcus albus]|uniref:Fibronectin type III domain protein n=1 Tax=Ruminococcus albus 8 TaxID=246199 RepID=E9SGH4_RUMAL|nr:BspA family leucine-rich repeat surface protein [Ruminococcus albus]EGC01673.1 fibronectin type III domain protein [Ruminococcus albus 8]MCC3350575.1 BspA family leucine-rich repeat surface protein [Ruminococcus albus 8]